MLLLILVPYMVTLFFHDDVGGLFQNSSESSQMEERVLKLVSEEISGQAELEAIKAQAVIARTTLYQNPDMEVTGNETNLLENMDTLEFCVEETAGEILTFEGKPIDAAYHAVSGKLTRNGEEVAGQEDKSYLKSVESLYDIASPDYLTIFYMEKTELAEKIQTLVNTSQNEGSAQGEGTGEVVQEQKEAAQEQEKVVQEQDTEAIITVNPETILTDLVIEERDSAEYVLKVRYGDVILNGEAVSDALGLSSSLFYFSELDGKVRVMTKGLGHGLGLSQYGANAQAAEGKKYEEILKYYYSGVEIEKVKSQ